MRAASLSSPLLSIHPGLMNAHDLNNHCTRIRRSAGRRKGGLVGRPGQTADGAEERVAAAASVMTISLVG